MPQPLRDFLRMSRRRPWLLITVLLSLAVGVGLNASLVELAERAFIAPLPYASANRLVFVVAAASAASPRQFVSGEEASTIEHSTDLFDAVATLEYWPATRRAWMDCFDGRMTQRVAAAFVSPNLFDLLGVQPSGPGFSALGPPGASVIVSAGFARAHPETAGIGGAIRLGGEWKSVSGVLPGDFEAPAPALPRPYDQLQPIAVWLLRDSSEPRPEDRSAQYVVIAKLRDGVSRVSATHQLNTRLQGLSFDRDPDYAVVPLRQAMLGESWYQFSFVALIAALLAAIAIVNVVLVWLLRIEERRRELVIRSALGATRRQLLSANLVEAAASAAVLGLVVGVVASDVDPLLRRWLPVIPWRTAGFSGPGYGHAVAVALLIGIVVVVICVCIGGIASRAFSALSYVSLYRVNDRIVPPVSVLQKVVLVLEIGFVTALVTPAIGLSAAMWRAEARYSFGRSTVVIGEAWLLDRTIKNVGAGVAQDRLLDRIRRIPGVLQAGLGTEIGLVGAAAPTWRVRARSDTGGVRTIDLFGQAVDDNFLRIVGIQLVSGRTLSSEDTPNSAPVALLSVSAAMRLFRTADAIGREIDWHGLRRVVGVVPDVYGADGTLRPTMYISRVQEPQAKMAFAIQATSSSQVSRIADALGHVDPDQPFDRIIPLQELLGVAFSRQRLLRSATVVLGVSALLLAGCGLIVLIRHAVIAERRATAVRLAHGATMFHICRELVIAKLGLHIASGLIAMPLALIVGHYVSGVAVPLATPGPWILFLCWVVIVTLCIAVRTIMAVLQARQVPALLLADIEVH